MHVPPARDAALLLTLLSLAACPSPRPADAGADDSSTDVPPPDAFVPAAHLPFPRVDSLGGAVIAAPTLVTVTAQNDALAPQLAAFADALVASRWWPAVASEYGVGPIARHVHAEGPALAGAVTDSQLLAYARDAATNAGAPAPDGSVIYLLFLPDGATESDDAGYVNTGCMHYRGAHFPVAFRRSDSLAFVQHCPLEPGQTTLSQLTEVASHEVLEAATDPDGASSYGLVPSVPSEPWLDDAWHTFVSPAMNELADLCHDARTQEGDWVYQRVWSNALAAAGGDPCAPATGSAYFSASPSQDWYAVAPGASVDIPVTGWSTAPVADWLLSPRAIYTSGPTFSTRLTAARTQLYNGRTAAVLQNGTQITYTVTAPANAPSGAFAVFWLQSIAADTPAGADFLHLWPVGVYVP